MVGLLRRAGGPRRVTWIVEQIAEHDLYRKQDGGYPTRNHVQATVSKRPNVFVRPVPGFVALADQVPRRRRPVPRTGRPR